jgi:hypothetical protein
MQRTFRTSATIGEVVFYVKEILSPIEKPAVFVRLPQERMAMLLLYLFVGNLFLTIRASTTFAPAAETTSGLMSSSWIDP